MEVMTTFCAFPADGGVPCCANRCGLQGRRDANRRPRGFELLFLGGVKRRLERQVLVGRDTLLLVVGQ